MCADLAKRKIRLSTQTSLRSPLLILRQDCAKGSAEMLTKRWILKIPTSFNITFFIFNLNVSTFFIYELSIVTIIYLVIIHVHPAIIKISRLSEKRGFQ